MAIGADINGAQDVLRARVRRSAAVVKVGVEGIWTMLMRVGYELRDGLLWILYGYSRM